ncbi:hypothetical protein EV191_12341 [Tamaricihabitans halophyticus]|uniref:DUF5709 domain-containing protein n=1 Tax=Tamaricihabitans halophyticus TaxID=1262583 RepID=A0A4R2Q788_9PSEU|nr:hypothetical protein [Tamaricihabitans halophyticus]TCP42641.1 hypothetical protein EV191_12341 [Tamaricihabitans halophyticus]
MDQNDKTHATEQVGSNEDVETDPAALNSSESLDEDRLQVDPLEKGVEPPERWAAANQSEMTDYEQGRDRGIDKRIAQEKSDTEPEHVPDRPLAATPQSELDESIDDVAERPEPVVPQERVRNVPTETPQAGRNADDAGGLAESLREPDDPS